ncbi:hypothetical protein ACV3V0_16115 [Clostridium perfringens]
MSVIMRKDIGDCDKKNILKPNFHKFNALNFDELYNEGSDFWEITYNDFDEKKSGNLYLKYEEAQKFLFSVDIYNSFIKRMESAKIERMSPVKAFAYRRKSAVGKNIGIGIFYKIRNSQKEADGYKPKLMEIKY